MNELASAGSVGGVADVVPPRPWHVVASDLMPSETVEEPRCSVIGGGGVRIAFHLSDEPSDRRMVVGVPLRGERESAAEPEAGVEEPLLLDWALVISESGRVLSAIGGPWVDFSTRPSRLRSPFLAWVVVRFGWRCPVAGTGPSAWPLASP